MYCVTGIPASRQEGEPCGQTTTEHCGDCDKGFFCSSDISPMIPKQCGICRPRLAKKGTNLAYSYEILILHYNINILQSI